MTDKLDAALRHALQDLKAGTWAADAQLVVDAIREIVREEVERMRPVEKREYGGD